MGERAPGLTRADGEPASRRIEKEISTLRREMSDLVGELDRRRREAFDVRLQLKRHPVAVSLAVVAAAVNCTVQLPALDNANLRRAGLSDIAPWQESLKSFIHEHGKAK